MPSTPTLAYGFPALSFWCFFLKHGLLLITPLCMIAVHAYAPKYRQLWKYIGALLIGLPFIYLINYLVKGNYWFIANVPAQKTILSLLGGWPWYIIVAELLGVGLFHLALVPFWLVRRRRTATPVVQPVS